MITTYHPYLAGEFISTGTVLDVRAPYDGTLLAQTWLCDETVIDKAIEKGLAVQEALGSLAVSDRFEALRYIASAITGKREELAVLLARESAKPYKYAIAEIDRAAQTFLVAAEEAKRLPGEVISLDWTAAGKGKTGIVQYFPVGLVAGISPFNFPLNLAVHKIAPAIATGCPIILKPASSTPLSTLELAKIIDRCGLPAGAVSILPADRKAGNLLVTDDRVRLLSFTGSDEVGWKMKKDSGKKKTVLELGGNAGVIIAAGTDIGQVVKKCITGAFSYAGQVCIHAQRFFVHRSLFDAFVKAMKEEAELLKFGAPEHPETDISTMIDQENADRVEAWVNEAVAQGAVLAAGGKKTGNYFEPTILINTVPAMKVNSEEAFGPVITIEPFDEFRDAVARNNETRFGLQVGVFTGAIADMDYAFRHADVGGVILNDVPTLRLDHMPYGGIKDSGIGREGVKYAMRDMLETKILVK